MKSYNQILLNILEAKESSKETAGMRAEKEARSKAGIPSTNSPYISRGHDSEDFNPELFDPDSKEKLRTILRKVWNVTPGHEFGKPDLWAAGPTIKTDPDKGENYVAVRPIDHMGQTHRDVFKDAYPTIDGRDGPSSPHVYGRIDHVRKEITMQTNHRHYFSSSALNKIHGEFKARYPEHTVVDLTS